MASLNDILSIGRSGVLTHQERLAVISHNIANVDTKGYHRQKAVLGTNPPNEPNLYATRNYSLGTGVKITDVIRLRDNLREQSLLAQTGELGEHELLAESLSDVETLMNGLGDASLSSRFQDFWAAWQDLANNADQLAYRSTLIENSVALTEQFNTLAGRLADYRTAIADGAGPTLSGSAVSEVTEINDLATRIQDLNKRITILSSQGFGANDLQDRRDLLVRELSGKANVTVSSEYEIRIDGQLLVSGDGNTRNDLSISNATSTPIELMLDGAVVNVNSGRLGALVETAAIVDNMSDNLDTLANELISQVNTIHQAGFDLDGNPGVEFFTGTGAAGIMVNPLIHNEANPSLDNPRLIAAAQTVHDPGPPVVANVRDGANALAIADLCRALVPGLGSQTFDGYFSNMLTGLGAQIQAETDLAADSQAIVDMLEGAIQSATGVNLDEELVEMINAQRAYQASARVITTADSMMDVVINRMGA
ncbi:MAG: flagellar hook-associated protein FlgK [Lentisphaerota bacterium]